MTANEIKNAWNKFKKEIAKEIDLDLTGCCYMTARQIANGTATITLQLDWSYDSEINYLRREIERVSQWGEEQRERIDRITREKLDRIADIEGRKAIYGTRNNEIKADAEKITRSSAFKKLADAIHIRSFALDFGRYSSSMNIYQLRINYEEAQA